MKSQFLIDFGDSFAAWLRRRGAKVVLVSAELRAYYAKHTKSDRLDSVLPSGYRCCTPRVCIPKGYRAR